ncbi:MAG: hypothetical protein ABIR78_10300 [Ferruginibacter sp.]
MQRIFILSAIFLLTISAEKCNEKKKDSDMVYKGRLEIKAICMNYTVKLLEGNIDTAKIVSNWTDETTKKTYSNVFALENPCNFPATIKQGEDFYFVIDTAIAAPCAVCMAWYPIPAKKLAIKIINK